MVTIRAAEDGDAAEITEVLNTEFENEDSDFFRKYSNTEEKILKDMKRCKYYVAVDGDRIVGAISLLLGDITCRIDDMAVRKGSQRRGIGKELVRFAENLAGEHGCSIIWCTTSKRLDASGFYLKMGFTASELLPRHFEGRDLIKLEKSLI